MPRMRVCLGSFLVCLSSLHNLVDSWQNVGWAKGKKRAGVTLTPSEKFVLPSCPLCKAPRYVYIRLETARRR